MSPCTIVLTLCVVSAIVLQAKIMFLMGFSSMQSNYSTFENDGAASLTFIIAVLGGLSHYAMMPKKFCTISSSITIMMIRLVSHKEV